MTGWFSARDAASTFRRLADRSGLLFEVAGRASNRLAIPPPRRVGLAVLSRLAGEHAEAWADLVPESVLLASARETGAAQGAGHDRADDPGVVLAGLLEDLDDVVARLSPVSDGAALRLARRAIAELGAAGSAV